MGREYRLISADGHVIEPPDMWSKYLPKKFADRAPQAREGPEGRRRLGAGARGPRRCRSDWSPTPASGASGTRSSSGSGRPTSRSCKGAYEGKARIEEQDIDGVDAEVLFPSQRTMGAFMAQEDDDYHLAGLEAYNTWMHDEFMAADPERLIGLAQMPGVDTPTAIKWLRDAKSAGYRGVIISAFPPARLTCPTRTTRSGRPPKKSRCRSTSTAGLRQAGKRKSDGFVPDRQQRRSAARSASPRWADRSGTRRSSCPSSSTRASSTSSRAFRWSPSSAVPDGSRTSSSTWTTTTGGTGPGRSRRCKHAPERVLPAELEGDVHP